MINTRIASGVGVAQTPEGLSAIHDPACAATIWDRAPSPAFQLWIDHIDAAARPRTRMILAPDAVRDALRQGAVMLYPTDTVYAIGCDLNAKAAIKKVRQLKQLSSDKPLTFLCASDRKSVV